MTSTHALAAMAEPRRALLKSLKGQGPKAISQLAEEVGITYEGVRQHLSQLELEGWIQRRIEPRTPGPGRPRSLYHLTIAGDHLFPKGYDDLAVALIDAAADRLGKKAVQDLLEEVATRKVEQWQPAVEGLPLEGRLEVLKNIYVADDPFCKVEYGPDEAPRLVEMNCPYLEVARRRPALCSVTVSVLRRLLGRPVVRTERFQEGDGRCVFRVLEKAPNAEKEPLFDWEPPLPLEPPTS